MTILVIVLLALLAVFVYLKGVNNERYWRKRGVVFHSRNKFLGIAWDYIINRRAFFEHIHDIYKLYPNAPAVGIGSVLKPALLLRDVENIRHITSTDFKSFHHKGFETIEEDVLANNIFFLNGNKWKIMRQSMTPLFTSSKLKLMYHTIDKSARDFIPYIRNENRMKGNGLDTMSTFCSAAMTAAVFGITAKSVFDSPLLKMIQKVSKPTFLLNLKFILSINTPIFMRIFKIKLFGEIEEFFVGAIRSLIRSRQKETVKRHDFADMCVSIQENGVLKDEETGFEVEPTDELLAAQAFFFFIAGVEPTATAVFNTLVLLSQHPNALKRLHDEIDNAFEKNEGNMSFEVVSQLEYLDMVLNEAMRIYPALGYVVRECVSDSVLPNGNIKIDKGTTIFLPIFAVHHDEKYYSDPEGFDPERFSRDNKAKLNEMAYLVFGKGKRNCIGMRYATLQAKAGLVQVLRYLTVKTIHYENAMKFKKEPIQVRLNNVDIQFIERKQTLIN